MTAEIISFKPKEKLLVSGIECECGCDLFFIEKRNGEIFFCCEECPNDFSIKSLIDAKEKP